MFVLQRDPKHNSWEEMAPTQLALGDMAKIASESNDACLLLMPDIKQIHLRAGLKRSMKDR